MGLIPDETFLALIRREAESRDSALADLRAALLAMEGTFNQKIDGVGAKLTATIKDKSVDASAIVGTIQRAQVEEGFALAEQINLLEARVTSDKEESLASYQRTITAMATLQSAQVRETTVLRSTIDQASATFTSEISTLATATSAMASSISTVTAAVAVKVRTFSQGTAPTATAVGDIWIDTSAGNQLKRWNGTSWVNSNIADGAISASVSVESSARATADGYLSGMYVVKVDVGGKVAGMAITAIANPGTWTTTSEISFNADAFKIWNGASDVAPFVVSGGVVTMQNAKVVSSLDVGGGTNRTEINSGGLTVGGDIHMGDLAGGAVLQVGSARIYANASGFGSLFTIGSVGVSLSESGAINTADFVNVGGDLTLTGSSKNIRITDGVIMKTTNDGKTPFLWHGSGTIEFSTDGTNAFVHVNGGAGMQIN